MTDSPETARAVGTPHGLSPAEAVRALERGNARFVTGAAGVRDDGARRMASADGQFPFALVLGCIDSRVPPETVFDQGIGDLFVSRVAGNVVSGDVLGSMEFACRVAGAVAIVVLGHTRCGAVGAAVRASSGADDGTDTDAVDELPAHLAKLVAKIGPTVASTNVQDDQARLDFADAVSEANVRHGLHEIRARSPVLRSMEHDGKIVIAGALYDVESGRVRFLAAS